ncbi:amidase [Pseudomonas syringae]|uniref:Amidase n=1 Tax=Pseudomonas syringae pv. aceris TaxID=199198 RepID=A0A0L8IQ26_PSESX|nr:amidase [Pseudomonas syringae]EGH71506.1 amidase [Pseudomonas syringae pv. aceris str. M302273]KOG03523.1 Amidase [Pseudomonas syringae pv. aceris]KPW09174.1 Amidase [Pseudomonas syringae pv. aceris]
MSEPVIPHMPAPSVNDILEISRNLGLGVSQADARFYAEVVGSNLANYDVVARLAAEGLTPTPTGREYTTPLQQDNPHNAWHVRSNIQTRTIGKLAGRTIAIKDSIPVAGLPMLAGANIFTDYIPDFDAEVVKRILNAGGTIAGKAHCEYLCFSGSSHTSVAGVIPNPWNETRSAGGSSSGSAFLVATGEVDMAMGADQAGSIRMPASFSGIVGLKPTYGLVPYTGVPSLDASFDHVGPMTATVSDAALLLSVIAGPDGVDARQHGVAPADYDAAMALPLNGLRIGVLKEGFEVPGSDPLVSARVREAADVLAKLGAALVELSIPMHRHGLDIWTTVGWTGMTETALKTNGFGIMRNDHYPVSLMKWVHDHGAGIEQAPPSIKLFFFISEYVRKQIGCVGYGNGINAARVLRTKYDEALKHVDLLLMPTTPMTATPLPDASTSIEEELKTSHPMALNTAPFDMTHHPALSLPCGGINGMPVGMMLVGRHYDESTLFRAGKAFEATGEGAFRNI